MLGGGGSRIRSTKLSLLGGSLNAEAFGAEGWSAAKGGSAG